MGRNAVASCEVVFDDLPIPRETLVGEFGRPIGQNQGIQHGPRRRPALRRRTTVRNRGEHGQVPGRPGRLLRGRSRRADPRRHGYATEYHVKRYFREARMLRITPVTEEQIMNYVAERALSLPKSY
jgi:acyl-CoA dehydrogenase